MPGAAVPEALRRNAVETWGAVGERWLDRLPALVDGVAREWELRLGATFDLSFNWVAAVTQSDGTEAVLKLGPPEPGHLADEAAALEAFGGEGAVRLLRYDGERGALLLERAEPGQMLRSLVPVRDSDATAAIISVTRRLHRRPSPGCRLPDLEAEAESFSGHLRTYPGDDPLPRRLVQRAGALFDQLCASAPQRVVLHGDLHHDNVLRASREPWLAIDPHGVVGDPGYDVGAMLYNPDPHIRADELLALVPKRIEQLAEGLDLSAERVVCWGFVMAVLSEVWTAQGGGIPGGRPLDVANALLPRLP
jgi:streptomycin 6-kinase